MATLQPPRRPPREDVEVRVMTKPQPMEPHGLTGRLFGWVMEKMNAASYRAAQSRLPKGADAKLLEIGFGTGALVERLARGGAALVAGVDPSGLMVETAKKRTAGHTNVDLRLGTAARLPWPDTHFDGAAALHSFQFWADPAACLAEVARVLKPGASLVLILRHHGGGARFAWLPNPLSHLPDEPDAAVTAIGAAGYCDAVIAGTVGTSKIVTARRGD